MYLHTKLWLALVAIFSIAGSADADIVIDWSQPSVSITIINSQNALITGSTTGDQVVPFQVMVSTTNATQQVSVTGPLGNNPNPLNLNMPAPRQAGSLMTIDISIPGYNMVNMWFDLLDVDAASENLPPFSSWQDQITFLNPGSGYNFTPVNPARYNVSGNQITAVIGPNIGNNSNQANVNVANSGSASNIRYTYGPGPFDLLGQNQRHGISNITIQSIVAIPEPGMTALVFLAFAGTAICRRRDRRPARSALW
jgi:hypothetical protein